MSKIVIIDKNIQARENTEAILKNIENTEVVGSFDDFSKVNDDADLIIFDPNEMWRVEEFSSKSKNSPFLGKMMLGKIKKTICAGKVVYDERL